MAEQGDWSDQFKDAGFYEFTQGNSLSSLIMDEACWHTGEQIRLFSAIEGVYSCFPKRHRQSLNTDWLAQLKVMVRDLDGQRSETAIRADGVKLPVPVDEKKKGLMGLLQ